MTWTCHLYTGASCWINQVSFPDPTGNDLIEDSIISSAETRKMIDGSLAITQPEHTFNLESITFNWNLRKNTTLYDRIVNYIKSGSGVKLTTHKGNEFIGQFTKIIRFWRLTKPGASNKQYYNLEVEFQQLETEMLRDQQW